MVGGTFQNSMYYPLNHLKLNNIQQVLMPFLFHEADNFLRVVEKFENYFQSVHKKSQKEDNQYLHHIL